MKKVLFLLSVVLLGFSSCVFEAPRGPQGPPGQDGLNGGGANTLIRDIFVAEKDWQYDNAGGFYTYTANVDFIDQYIYDNGIISIFIDYGKSQQILPVVRHFEKVDNNNNVSLWTRTTDYEFGVGEISFFVTNSDFVKERPEDMLFRVCAVWEE